jgi:hypothetical protein
MLVVVDLKEEGAMDVDSELEIEEGEDGVGSWRR